jgi:hypothetical protein
MKLYNINPGKKSELAFIESDASIRFLFILRNIEAIIKPLLIRAIISI